MTVKATIEKFSLYQSCILNIDTRYMGIIYGDSIIVHLKNPETDTTMIVIEPHGSMIHVDEVEDKREN
jgi:hypothetical protein